MARKGEAGGRQERRVPSAPGGEAPDIPTAEYQSVIQKEAEQPLRVAYERRNRDLDPQFWSDLVGSRSNMRDEERYELMPFTIKSPEMLARALTLLILLVQ